MIGDKKYAKGLHIILYFIMCILSMIMGNGPSDADPVLVMAVGMYSIITTLFLYFYSKYDRMTNRNFMLVSGCMMLFLAWMDGMHTGNILILYILSFIPLATTMLFMELSGYKLFLCIFCVQFFVSMLLPNGMFRDNLGIELKVAVLCVYIMIGIVFFYFIKLCGFRERYNSEQERSLEDLQKVIMGKCLEAKAATRAKSDFLSNMSHEIRTPLNAILGMNEMIVRENRDDNIAKYASNIDRSGKMLLALINDTLDFSKIESGRLELINADYRMDMIIRDVLVMLESRIRLKQLKLNIDISPDIPAKLNGDEIRIKQIITNIMTNAVKYTDVGSISLSLSKDDSLKDGRVMLKLCIADTGQGMNDENLRNLFDSFSRFNLEQNRQVEGTGLGMAITKRLIDMMGGSIEVESAVGEGTTFYVYIPQTVADKTPMGEFVMNPTQKSEPAKKEDTKFVRPDLAVLVVDDSKVNLAVAKGLLKYSKMQVKTATSGRECLELLGNNKYDIILLDHMMPNMDGIETLRIIKEGKLCEGVPIVALTANAIGNAREQYLAAGFDDYLSKPISAVKLEEVMKKWLG